MEYVLVDRNDNIVDKKDLSDIGINGARTFFIKRKQIVEESFDKLWKVMTKKEYNRIEEAHMRKPSSQQIEWWKEEDYLDLDKL